MVLTELELAISESQERMACVIAPDNLDAFLAEVSKENLEAAVVARVTDNRRLKMKWRGKTIVDLSRDFIDTNGVKQNATVKVISPDCSADYFDLSTKRYGKLPLDQAWKEMLSILMSAVRRLWRTFCIFGASLLLPFGNTSTPKYGCQAACS